jgi:DNA (cytosine-5)-methyltransferase 1
MRLPVERGQSVTKPPYSVPLMSEVAAVPSNGFKVASTFSGCGGSCLGYRMAGFKVVWANEFVPAAQASYKANAAKDCVLDVRDIRQVQTDDILKATGIDQGGLDLFDGSPPCQAFSTAGKREKGWGKERHYEHGAVQRNETLFAEYVRLLRGLMPKVFIAENVSGLVKGKAKGWFLEILRDLKASGYEVEVRLLDAQWLGVPQTRQRIIFQGVRNDLKRKPAWPAPLPYRYSVRDALGGITDSDRVIHDESGEWSAGDIADRPCPTVRSGRAGTMFVASRDKRGAFGKQGAITERPAPAVLSGTVGNLWIEGANGFNGHAASTAEKPMPTVQAGRPKQVVQPGLSRRKFTIAELKRVCAFPDDFVLVGTYAQQWERLGNSVPPVMMRHVATAIRNEVLTCEKADG